ncbi:MAG TPA: YncE family protein [Planctomycetota bacterium]|nr:YncE family protein [Planctomycetota bacterium]
MVLKLLPALAPFLLLAAPAAPQEKPSGLAKSAEIVLEGGTSFDYVNVDAAGNRLFVAHGPKIDVVDPKKGAVVGEVTGVDGSHGAIAVHEVKRGFATAGRKNRLIAFDLETYKTQKEIETGQNPDALLYVASVGEVWTFNGRSKNISCIDASTLEVKATIALGGKPEAPVEHPEKGLVYVNLEDKSAIAVVDSKKHEVVATHSLAPGEEPTGLAFDAKNGLLFAGCGNKKLVAIDLSTWKVAGTADIGEHCDGVAFDPGTGNVFASAKDKTGGLHVQGPASFEALTPLETPGGKTCAIDPRTHTLYVTSGPPRGAAGAVKVLVFSPP